MSKDKTAAESLKRSLLLLERLEDRVMFDAVPDAPMDTDVDAALAALPYEHVSDVAQASAQDAQASDAAVPADARRELVVVDGSVDDYEQLVQSILSQGDPNRRIDVVVLDAETDGVESISQLLEAYNNVDALHLISHGDQNGIQLGNTFLSGDNVSGYVGEMAAWGRALNADADLLIYGCDLAAGESGRALVDTLTALTGADVAASDDLTGAAGLGGDWDLELRTGRIETATLIDVAGGWQQVLTTGQVNFENMNWNDGDLQHTVNNDETGNEDVKITVSGDTEHITAGPVVNSNNTGGFGATDGQSLYILSDFDKSNDSIVIDIAFAHAGGVDNVSFSIFDIDSDLIDDEGKNAFADQVTVTASNNGTNFNINPSSITTSTLNEKINANTVQSYDQGGASGNQTTGNAKFDFNGSGITHVRIEYKYPDAGKSKNPNQQAISLHDVNFEYAGPPTLDLDASNSGPAATDNFGSASYSGGSGWSTDWIEVDPAGAGPSAGDVTINSGSLRISNFTNYQNGGVTVPSVEREADLSGLETANLSFNYSTGSGVDASDDLVVELSSDGGKTYTVLQSITGITGTTSGSFDLDVTDYISAETRVRFRVNNLYGGTNEFVRIDNLTLNGTHSAYTATFDVGSVMQVAIADTDSAVVGAANMSQAVVTLQNAHTNDQILINGAASGTIAGSGITYSSDASMPGKIVFTLTGAATRAQYESALESIRFTNTDASPNTTTRLLDSVVTDNLGRTSNTARTTITFTGGDQAPTAVDDSVVGEARRPITIDVAANDSDPEGALDALSVTLIDPATGLPASGNTLTVAGEGVYTVDAQGRITFTPDDFFSGNNTPIQYTIADAAGNTSNAVNLNIRLQHTCYPLDIWLGNDESGSVDNTEFSQSRSLVADVAERLAYGNEGANSALFTWADAGAQQMEFSLTADQDQFTTDVRNNYTRNFNGGTSISGGIDFGVAQSTANGRSGVGQVLVMFTDASPAQITGDANLPTSVDNAKARGITLIFVAIDEAQSDPAALAVLESHASTDGDGNPLVITAASYAGITSLDQFLIANAVCPTSHPPTAVDDDATTDEDQPVTITVLDDDTDPDGDTLSVDSFTQPTNGTVVLNGDGTFTYTPNANFNGNDSFTYTVSDGKGGTDEATVNVTVNPINDAPVAVDDAETTNEDAPVTITVLDDDTDVDGDTLSVDSFTQPSNGTVVLNGDGTFTYTPDADFNGNDSFTYTVSDGKGGTDEATVSITVDPINDAPVAVDDSATTDEDQPVTITVLDDDTDVDGDALSVDSFTQPSNGTVVLNGDGTFTYTPDANFHGNDSFTYTVADGKGGTDEATVSITVDPINDAPVAVDDSATTDEDQPVTITVLDDDTDVDGDALSVDSFTQPSNGTVVLNGDETFTYTPNANFNGNDSFTYTVSDGKGGTDEATVNVTVNPINDAPAAVDDATTTDEDAPVTITVLVDDSDVDGDTLSVDSFTQPTSGTVVLNGDGTFTYTPDADFNGNDSFTYTVTDGKGGTDEATVNVTVNPINDAPVAVDDATTTDEDAPVTITVLDDDSDVDGDTLSVDSFTQPTSGTVVLNGDGTFTYTPDADFNGNDSFTYTVSDGKGGTGEATVNVTVNPVNDAPVAVDDTATTDEDAPVTITVLDDDTDVDGDALSVDSFTQPTNGTVVLNGDGTFTYTPVANFNGNDSFTYTVTDGKGGTDEATVNVTVNPVNDAPVAVDDAETTDEDQPVTMTVLDDDTDLDGDALSVDSFTQPSNGTVVLNGDGTFTYTPDADFNGNDSFTYTVSDGKGGTDEATVNVTVNPINDAPVAVDDAETTDEDQPVTITVLDDDTDVDGDTLSVDSFTQPTNGTVVLNGDGTFTYTPDADFNGNDSFTYTVTDGKGGTDEATVSITVNPVNDAPLAVDDAETTDEDTPVTITVLDDDTDLDGDALSVDSFTQPSNGTVVLNGDGTFTYTPDVDFNGNDSFTYMVSDGKGGTDEATVSITVDPINDAPVAVDDSATTDEDAPVTMTVLDDDTDVDGDALSVDSFTQPSNGTVVLNGDGTFTYTPDADFNGNDSFTYTVSDGKGGTDEATVNVTVNPINDAPVAVDDAETTDEDQPVTITVLDDDTDVDGDTLSVDSFMQPTNGTVVLNGDGTFTYTPGIDYIGGDSFTYTVTDDNGGTSSATVELTVKAVNDAPTTMDATVTTDEDASYVFTIDDFPYSDVEADPVASVTIDALPTDGELTLNGNPVLEGQVVSEADIQNGLLIFTPDVDENGGPYTTFDFTVSDGTGDSVPATMTINVDAVNDAPTAADDAASTDEDAIITGNVINGDGGLGEDADVDGDKLSVTRVNDTAFTPGEAILLPSGALLTMLSDGSYTYNPNDAFDGLSVGDTATDSFAYTVADGNGGFDTATVSVEIGGLAPDLTVATDDGGATATPGSSVEYTVTYANDGNQTATGVVITETLPPGTTFDPDNGTPGWIDQGDGTIRFDVGDFPAGDGDTITFTVLVDDVVDAGQDFVEASARSVTMVPTATTRRLETTLQRTTRRSTPLQT